MNAVQFFPLLHLLVYVGSFARSQQNQRIKLLFFRESITPRILEECARGYFHPIGGNIMQKGNVSWAVSLYRNLKQSEKAVDRNEDNLNQWLKRLSKEEFEEYAAITVKIDEKENES